MFGSLYTALAGMNAYSKGLEVISNNVANLNTPGFKVSDPLFREIVYQHLQSAGSRDAGGQPAGAGSESQTASLSFRQGTLRETDNPLDVAIEGAGFFVLQQDGERRYTRAGQFAFNDEGILVERASGALVMLNTPQQAEGSFDIDPLRSFAPRATREVTLSGTLVRTGSASAQLSNFTVFDSAGTRITLRAQLTRADDDPLSWTVEVVREEGEDDVTLTGDSPPRIRFEAGGTPAADASRVTVSVQAANGENFDVVLNFGQAGSFTGVSSPGAGSGGTSQLRVVRQDGAQLGSLLGVAFDENGTLQLTYTNGETVDAGTLVLAQFNRPEQLLALEGGMFAANEDSTPLLGKGLTLGLGSVRGSRVEGSNVELTQQFTDLIIMQRGFQASSQVSSVSNELIQTLLAMDGNR